MKQLTTSYKIYIGLILTLSVLAAINVFLPQTDAIPAQSFPLPKPLFAALLALGLFVGYGGLGYIGLKLSNKLGFADIWDSANPIKYRLLLPAILGIVLGGFFILADVVLKKFHSLGTIPHPPFPSSIFASATAGIGEEVLFRLFYISFWVWLISSIILKGKGKNLVFWIVVAGSGVVFTVSHFPAVMYLFHLKTVGEIPPALILELVLINGILSIFAAYYFRKYGLLAAASIHFWADIVWHVIWGTI